MKRNILSAAFVIAWIVRMCTEAEAGTIVQPSSASTNMGSFVSSVVGNLVNATGLLSPYVNGVTDFDAYIATNPVHVGINTSRWFSTSSPPATTGNVDFDLGGAKVIESMALWNIGGNSDQNINGFNLLADADGDFSSGAITLLTGASANPNLGPTNAVLPQVFTFSPTSAAFVRMEITSNHGGFVTGAGEVVFELGIPEPCTSALALVALSLIFGRRR